MAEQRILQDFHFSRLLRAAEGLTQWRALMASFVTFVVAAAICALGSYLAYQSGSGAQFVLALTAVVAFVVVCSGLSAVGVMLMDRAKSIPVRSLMDAFVYGLMCLPKFIGFALFILAVVLALALVAAMVYFVCKIPGIGPLLLFFAHPVLVVAGAVVFAAIAWVGVPLFAPAVWDGRSFSEALSLLLAAAKSRLLVVVASILLLYVVAGIVAGLVFGTILPSLFAMMVLATQILGSAVAGIGSWVEILPTLIRGGEVTGGSGHLMAMLMATALIYGVVASLLVQVLIMGISLVYLICTEGLDVAASQAAIEGKLNQVKQKAAEAQERARQAADNARQAAERARAQPAPAAAAAAGNPAATNCPKCNAVVMAADPFCNECGFKLK